MTGSKRPSTSSLRRFITSRPYVPIAELRRRFGLDEPDAIHRIERNGDAAYIGLPEREAMKVADLWGRDEIGIELSVEVRAPVVVGIYPLRIASFVTDQPHVSGAANGHPVAVGNGHPAPTAAVSTNGPAPANGVGRSDVPAPLGPAPSPSLASRADAPR